MREPESAEELVELVCEHCHINTRVLMGELAPDRAARYCAECEVPKLCKTIYLIFTTGGKK